MEKEDILKLLKMYICNAVCDNGEPISLVDMLTPDDAISIQAGIDEIESLADYLYDHEYGLKEK